MDPSTPNRAKTITEAFEASIAGSGTFDLANQPGLDRFFAASSLAFGVQGFIKGRLEKVYELLEYMKGERARPEFDHVDLVSCFTGSQSGPAGSLAEHGHFLRLSPWDLTMGDGERFLPGLYLEIMKVLPGGFDPNSSRVIRVLNPTRELGELLMGDEKLPAQDVVTKRLLELEKNFESAYERAVQHLLKLSAK